VSYPRWWSPLDWGPPRSVGLRRHRRDLLGNEDLFRLSRIGSAGDSGPGRGPNTHREGGGSIIQSIRIDANN
jgi:hypothetical protein